MFKVYQYGRSSVSYIARELGNHYREYLHSDGNVYGTKEYWPTHEEAQTVLDEYQRKIIEMDFVAIETKVVRQIIENTLGGTIMFKVTRWTNNGNWSVTDENKNYMHADGNVYHRCGEYWPTRKLAQAVLDKYQPPHVWEHGDVFESGYKHRYLMVYLKICGKPKVFCLEPPIVGPSTDIAGDLDGATFLFNIKDKL